MLLSLRHKFIFIHIYKAAGTSVTHALRPFTREPFLRRHTVPRLPDHVTAAEIRESIGDLFDQCFKFTFVRNPWDWQVSLYHYMSQTRKHPQHHLIRNMSFDTYIRWRVTEDKHLQKEFVTDTAGKTIVDFIGRFENLESDFAAVCERIGISAKLPHRNRSSHAEYQTYYDDETRELVAAHFREDIEFFGFRF